MRKIIVSPAMAAGLQRVFAAAGSKYRLAADLGINRTSIGRWKAVPIEWLSKIEQLYDVPRAEQRPDLFGGRRDEGD